jgi:hypothetical protein
MDDSREMNAMSFMNSLENKNGYLPIQVLDYGSHNNTVIWCTRGGGLNVPL